VSVATYTLEIGAAIWFSLPSVLDSQRRNLLAKAAAAAGTQFDRRSRATVVHDLRSQGIPADPSIFPQGLLQKQSDKTMKSVISLKGAEVLPLASISHTFTVLCNETGKFLSYVSDEHGFNNPPNIWDKRAIEIVAVGDSYVQGYCVPAGDSFVDKIRNRHPATLGLGIEGNGPLVMLATIKEYVHALKPKVVLWFYYEGNDFADLRSEKDSPLLRRYLTSGFTQGLLGRQSEIDQALSDFIEPEIGKSELRKKLEEMAVVGRELKLSSIESILKLSAFRKRLGLIQGPSNTPSTPSIEDESRAQAMGVLADLLHNILLEAKRSVSECGGTLYFVYLPAWPRYATTEDGGSDSLGASAFRMGIAKPDRDRALHSAISAGLPVIDIHQAFIAQPDPLALFPFRLAHHYNEAGQRLVAQEVLRAISPRE